MRRSWKRKDDTFFKPIPGTSRNSCKEAVLMSFSVQNALPANGPKYARKLSLHTREHRVSALSMVTLPVEKKMKKSFAEETAFSYSFLKLSALLLPIHFLY
jgi:hypothetical protein